MKIRKGFLMREVAGKNVVIATGEAAKNFNGIIKLNESATMLWRMLESDASEEKLVDAIIETYEVDYVTAQNDVSMFVTKLKGAGIVDE
ncbi:MAG: PqqD family protein [Ruminococcaceae bacterium]|nr:PqqD family protein [Oscillospiraceae bacterium]